MIEEMVADTGAADFSHYSSRIMSPLEARALLGRDRLTNPVPFSEELGGFHIFRNFDDVKRGLMNFATYASAPAVQRPLPNVPIETFPLPVALNSDPPEHNKWRKLLTVGMNASIPRRIEEMVRADTIELLDGIMERGGGDLATELAHQIPQRAILYVLGFDRTAQLSRIHDVVTDMFRVSRDSPEYLVHFNTLAEFGLEGIEERRKRPREDFLTILANYDFDGRPLTDWEIGRVIATLFIGGSGTTTSTITSLLWNMFSQPGLRKTLTDDPSVMPDAIEETLRLWGAFFALFRTATEDHEVHGSRIAKGDTVYMCWQAANLDPAQFEDPHAFRLGRPSKLHLTFGMGRHSCIGAPTARMEMRVVAEEFLKRCKQLQPVDLDKTQFCFMGSETFAIPSLPVTMAA